MRTNMQWKVIYLIGFVFLWGLGAPEVNAKSSDLISPEKTIQTFVKALNKADLMGAAACVVGAKPKTEGLSEMWKVTSETFSASYSTNKPVITLQTNSATAQLQVKLLAGKESISRAERLQLRHSREGWKILPEASPNYMKPGGFLQEKANLLAHPEELLKVFFRAKGTAIRFSCTNNLRDVAKATLKFATDHQGRFAFSARSFATAIRPGLKSMELLHCREVKTGNSYSFNSHLEGRSLRQISTPSNIVMIYEGSAERLAFRHKDFRNQKVAIVAFADGSVKEVNSQQAVTLRWKP